MENNRSLMGKTRAPLKTTSLIFGILSLIGGITGILFDKEGVFYFPFFVGLYFMLDAFKERLMIRFGQKNSKIMDYILGIILFLALAFTLYMRYIK